MVQIAVEKKLHAPQGWMNLSVHFEIQKGSLVTLYGKSGAGKTSVLRMIAGLLQPDRGTIAVNGKTWFNSTKKINLSPQKRRLGFLFQDYALFPNMTVRENLLFALQKGQDGQIVDELIETVELGNLQHFKPQNLSGGQQQRTALARALVQRPEVLLLDEPLSALDHEMRKKLQSYILQLHESYQLTTILISHDIDEILKMSDEIVEINQGVITRKGAPEKVLTTAEIGQEILLHGQVLKFEKLQNRVALQIELTGEVLDLVLEQSQITPLKAGNKVTISSILSDSRIIHPDNFPNK